MTRAFLFVLDSVGIGGAPDAQKYGDEGANTVGHIAEACALGRGDRDDLRAGPLCIPNLVSMGLGAAVRLSAGLSAPGLDARPSGVWGVGVETSNGKDTPSGHWEMTGVPVRFNWTLFPNTLPAFPKELTDSIIAETGLPGILGNKHASGTDILDEFAVEHIRTGKPICYTSADSVLQIAAHEEQFGLERLYDLCLTVRRLVDPIDLGRVIARPFAGDAETGFHRTGNRRDFSMPPPERTLLDRATASGRQVIGMGKIGDIFAHRGITDERKAHGNMPLFEKTLTAMDELDEGGLLFANFVDFDSEFGHRRDVPGYAAALEEFDSRLPEALAKLRPEDLLILTADHGNDPTTQGNDHTREQLPILVALNDAGAVELGRRQLSDIGATIGAHLKVEAGPHGSSFLDLIGVQS